MRQDPPNQTLVRKAPIAAPAFYRIADVLRIAALSRATLYRRIADRKFSSARPPGRAGVRLDTRGPASLGQGSARLCRSTVPSVVPDVAMAIHSAPWVGHGEISDTSRTRMQTEPKRKSLLSL